MALLIIQADIWRIQVFSQGLMGRWNYVKNTTDVLNGLFTLCN